ncbi:MAG: ThuA domain-containing protein [Armatimonadetes bacterium]|nr:ThuA domain-containing protein [Armatimonadota bacterium]MDW8027800.1 ThuA domain-containing protein [Armatimonadota bacterium]
MKMRQPCWCLLGGAVVMALGLFLLTLPSVETEAEVQQVKRLMFVNLSMGFRHSATAVAADAVIRLGWHSNPRFLTTVTEDTDLLVPEILQRYDAIMFYTTGELPMSEAQKQSFLDFIKNGKGFIGVHSATDTFYNWAEFGELIGGYFAGHPWHEDVRIIVEDKEHPATKHLGDVWELKDEIYTFRNWSREKVRVLLSLDPISVDIKKGNRPDQDYALAWCRYYGKGRVFYTALGHEEYLWRDQKFLQHLLGGILWAMGVLPGDATPRPKQQR